MIDVLLQAAFPGLDAVKIIADLGMGAMVVWVLLHVFRKLIPDMQAQGIRQVEAILATHKAELAEMRVALKDGAIEDRKSLDRVARAMDRLTTVTILYLSRQGGPEMKSLIEQLDDPAPIK